MATHLVILVHGLWGNTAHFEYVRLQLELVSDESLTVHITGLNEYYKTYDGIDVCGMRVAREIEEVAAGLQLRGHSVTRILVVGYLLGGLIARYAVGILYFNLFFDTIAPENFVTFCTPHVGVWTPGPGILVRIFNWLVPFLLAQSGRQLFLQDTTANNEPLLVNMALSLLVFFRALQGFRHKALYANIVNDKRTSWFTAGISAIDPFDSMRNSNPNIPGLGYVAGYAPVVVDVAAPVTWRGRGPAGDETEDCACDDVESVHAVDAPVLFWLRKWQWVVALANVTVFAPVWVLWFIVSSCLERFKLHKRWSDFFRETKADMVHYYLPLEDKSDSWTLGAEYLVRRFEDDIQDHADEVMDRVWNAMALGPADEDTALAPVDLRALVVALVAALSATPHPRYELAVLAGQRFIISQLNTLGWRKFPVHIHNTKSSHAAAIVRHHDKHFGEGRVVVRHFVDEVFVM